MSENSDTQNTVPLGAAGFGATFDSKDVLLEALCEKTFGVRPSFRDEPVGTPAGDIIVGHSGMTLRDYFAAKAMQGMLANSDYVDAIIESAEDTGRGFAELISGGSMEMADAMLEARKEGGKDE